MSADARRCRVVAHEDIYSDAIEAGRFFENLLRVKGVAPDDIRGVSHTSEPVPTRTDNSRRYSFMAIVAGEETDK